MGSLKYCGQEDERYGDGCCPKIAMANSDYCAEHTVSSLQSLVNSYSRSRLGLKSKIKKLEENLAVAEAMNKTVLAQSVSFEKEYREKLSVAVEVLEMVEDHRKMPHQHYDPVTKLYCLTERAREALVKINA